jgi:predicted alpha/beta superfamily hydrolase
MVEPFFQPGIEMQSLHSEILDQDLELYVKLPWHGLRNNASYPVLFVLDANRSFPLYSTMSLIYETPGEKAEEIILVGIGYKLDPDRIKGLAQWAAWRTRDFTIEQNKETELYWKKRLSAITGTPFQAVQSGQAGQFLETLRQEVIPFTEAHYPLSSDRGLAGYSYGGLFAWYALFHASELFQRYFIGSPTMKAKLFEYEEQYASDHNNLDAKVYITEGEMESDLHDSIQRMVIRLRARGYPGLELQTHVFEGEGHTSAYAAAVSRALRVLYGYNLA